MAGKDEGVATHPEGATAWTQRSVILRRRRSAEAEPAAKPGLLYYGLPYYHVPVVPVVPVIKGDGIGKSDFHLKISSLNAKSHFLTLKG